MSYLVMECHPGYAVLLDEDGRFLKAANLRYEVGQTVYDPVLMKETAERQRHTMRWISSGIAAIAACFLLFFGIHYYQKYLQPYSSIYLTINPTVQMDLNRQGTVVRLTGINEDGKALLEGYDSKGKDKVTVADELIDRAIEMGGRPGFLLHRFPGRCPVSGVWNGTSYQSNGAFGRTDYHYNRNYEPPRRTGTGKPGKQLIFDPLSAEFFSAGIHTAIFVRAVPAGECTSDIFRFY